MDGDSASFDDLLAREKLIALEQGHRASEIAHRRALEASRQAATEARRRADVASRALQIWEVLTTQAWPNSGLETLCWFHSRYGKSRAIRQERRRYGDPQKVVTVVAAIPFVKRVHKAGIYNDTSGRTVEVRRFKALVVSPLLPPFFVGERDAVNSTPCDNWTIDDRMLARDLNREFEDRTLREYPRPALLGVGLEALIHGKPQRIQPTSTDVVGLESLPADVWPATLDRGLARWCAQNGVDLSL